LREEVILFERYKRQFDFLHHNKIETVTQLDRYEQNLDSLIAAMTDQRAHLYKERQRGADVGDEIESITTCLRRLRSEQKIIAGVREKTPEIEYRLGYADQERARLAYEQERRTQNRQPQQRRTR
jgi:vacuolar-type H+-ATPase subunit I/STV1